MLKISPIVKLAAVLIKLFKSYHGSMRRISFNNNQLNDSMYGLVYLLHQPITFYVNIEFVVLIDIPIEVDNYIINGNSA